MTTRVEWMSAHATAVVGMWPNEVEEISPDGNTDDDYAIAIESDEATLVYGSPEHLMLFAERVMEVAKRFQRTRLEVGQKVEYRPPHIPASEHGEVGVVTRDTGARFVFVQYKNGATSQATLRDCLTAVTEGE